MHLIPLTRHRMKSDSGLAINLRYALEFLIIWRKNRPLFDQGESSA